MGDHKSTSEPSHPIVDLAVSSLDLHEHWLWKRLKSHVSRICLAISGIVLWGQLEFRKHVLVRGL